jgi:DNA-binding winged helix-turn-helix (wHTH) protein/TolB-like protein/tetratricopeptide (TPR) repeat protein
MLRATATSLDAGFLLAGWEVRPRHGTLLRRDGANSAPIRLEPRVMAVLVCLARHGGEVVTRDEFIAEVWDGRVVSDEALSRCVSLLRAVFSDDSREPRFIRTVARIGYTLLQAPVPLAPTDAAAVTDSSPTSDPLSEPPTVGWFSRRHGRERRRIFFAGALCTGVALTLAGVYSLRGGRAPAEAPPPVTRLAVLPFDTTNARDFGRDVGAELADEIVDSLASVEQLRISGRTSTNALAASHADIVEVGRRLGVDAVLHGTVAESAEGLRIAVALTATSDARVLWSKVYERSAADIFAVQSSIASAVVRELVGLLTPDGIAGVPSIEPGSRDLQAYQLYMRGAHQIRLRGEESLRLAIDLFSAAARRDPTYARAQIGLANAYALLPSYSFEDPADMYALADKALVTAERLTGTRSISAGTRAYLGFMRWRWIDSETAFRTAIATEPNNPDLRQMYSQLLGAVGRLDAALAQAHLAQELDPLAPVVADRIGILHLELGRDEDAARDVALGRELGLEEVAYPETKILLELHQHEDTEAAQALRGLQSVVQRSNAWIDPTIDGYRHPSLRPAAIALLDRALQSGGISARLYFGAMVLLESPERALRSFATLANRSANDLEFLFSKDATAVRRDPAFGQFVRTLGIDAYWDRFGWPGACRRNGAGIECR